MRWVFTVAQCQAQKVPHAIRRVLVSGDERAVRCDLCGHILERSTADPSPEPTAHAA